MRRVRPALRPPRCPHARASQVIDAHTIPPPVGMTPGPLSVLAQHPSADASPRRSALPRALSSPAWSSRSEVRRERWGRRSAAADLPPGERRAAAPGPRKRFPAGSGADLLLRLAESVNHPTLEIRYFDGNRAFSRRGRYTTARPPACTHGSGGTGRENSQEHGTFQLASGELTTCSPGFGFNAFPLRAGHFNSWGHGRPEQRLPGPLQRAPIPFRRGATASCRPARPATPERQAGGPCPRRPGRTAGRLVPLEPDGSSAP